MKEFYYYKSLRKTIIQFLDLFNDINVARYEGDGSTVIKYVKVPLKFAGKEKIWHWWHERKDDAMLPMLSATLVSVDYAMDRQVSRLTNLVKSVSPSAGGLEQFLNPIPYNLGFTLNIWSLYMSDADQILEQILPYFSPNVTIRINIPEVGGSFDVKVIFQSCTPDVTQEIGDEEHRIILWNLDFLVHTYLFQPVKDPGLIKEIIMKLYATEESWGRRGTYTDGSVETTFTSGASGHEAEAMYIKATKIDGSWYDDAGDPYAEYQIFGNTELGADLLGGLGDCATDWFDNTSGGWAHNGGTEKYDCPGTAIFNADIWEDTPGATIGENFEVRFTISNYSAGSIALYNPFASSRSITANGRYTFSGISTADELRFRGDSDFIGSIDGITIQRRY